MTGEMRFPWTAYPKPQPGSYLEIILEESKPLLRILIETPIKDNHLPQNLFTLKYIFGIYNNYAQKGILPKWIKHPTLLTRYKHPIGKLLLWDTYDLIKKQISGNGK